MGTTFLSCKTEGDECVRERAIQKALGKSQAIARPSLLWGTLPGFTVTLTQPWR